MRRLCPLLVDVLLGLPRPDDDDQGATAKAGKLFELSDDEVTLLQEAPYRGALPTARRPTR